MSAGPPPVTAPPATWRCRRCGNCCRVEGYVRIAAHEIDGLADAIGVASHEFADRFTRLTDDRQGLSLTEKPDGSCVFLQDDASCRVQRAKPHQCRSFPHAWSFPQYERICEGCREVSQNEE